MSYSYRRPRVTLVWPAPLDYDDIPSEAECADLVPQNRFPFPLTQDDHRTLLLASPPVEVHDDEPF